MLLRRRYNIPSPRRHLSSNNNNNTKYINDILSNHKFINNKISYITYNGNPVNEDRHIIDTNVQTYGVFDGHGGSAASTYCENNILRIYNSFNATTDMHERLRKTFLKIDDEFLQTNLENGNYKDGCSGACACVCHINNNVITVANAGDCRAIIGSINGETKQLSYDHDCTNKNEVRRLLEEHPNEYDIIGHIDDPRVKGMLQPTRGIGDGAFKLKEYANKCRISSKVGWNPPYTTADPEITEYTIEEKDQFLVIASDGLFQDMKSEEIVQHVSSYFSSTKGNEWYNTSASTFLLYHVLIRAAKFAWSNRKILSDEHNVLSIHNLSPSVRRRVLDDVTIIVIELNDRQKELRSSL